MPDDERAEPLPHDCITNFDDEHIHRIRVSPRMLNELLVFGITTSAGTAEFGPELLVLEHTGDTQDIDIMTRLHGHLSTLDEVRTDRYSRQEDSDA